MNPAFDLQPSTDSAQYGSLPHRQVEAAANREKGEERERSTTRLGHFAACAPCRKRKLRCDGIEPICGTCSRASRECLYQDLRKGVRKQRTSIKILEARLAELESRGKHKSGPAEVPVANDSDEMPKADVPEALPDQADMMLDEQLPRMGTAMQHPTGQLDTGESPSKLDAYLSEAQFSAGSSHMADPTNFYQNFSSSNSNDKSPSSDAAFAIVSLGLEESLPIKEAQDDLNELYFSNIHPFIPIIHPARYLASASLPFTSRLRPPPCLSYAMWSLAATTSECYGSIQDVFYRRARRYAELDEMKSYGELSCTLAHTQTWGLLAMYEQLNLYPTRGFQSIRKAAALCISLGLHKLDGVGLTTAKFSPPVDDWMELEERRRVFWLAFTHDRYICHGAGWPPVFEEQDIQTDLPMPEEAFTNGVFSRGMKLSEAMTPAGARNASTFAARCVIASLMGRIFVQLHRSDTEGRSLDDLDNKFWKSYREIESILLNTVLCFPGSMAAASGLNDPNVLFLILCIHTCVISLHQTAQFAAGKNPRLAEIGKEAKSRCVEASQEIVNALQQSDDQTLLKSCQFTPYALYTGARVFLLALKETPGVEAESIRESIRFLISKLQLLKPVRPFIATLLAQLDVDLEALGDLNPIGHITTVKQTVDNMAHGVDNNKPSPVDFAVTSNSNSNTEFSQSQFTSAPDQSTGMNETIGAFQQRPTNAHRAYSDPSSGFDQNFILSMQSSQLQRPTSVSVPPGYLWPPSDSAMFPLDSGYVGGVGSANAGTVGGTNSQGDLATTMPMDMGMEQPAFMTYGPCAGGVDGIEWDGDFTWNFAAD